MFFKYAIFFCVVLLFVDNEASTVKRDVSSSSQPTLNIESLKKNMEQFKNCIDQSLSSVVGEVNEKQLQPLFNVIGDNLNRFSRAFEDLTVQKSDSRPEYK